MLILSKKSRLWLGIQKGDNLKCAVCDFVYDSLEPASSYFGSLSAQSFYDAQVLFAILIDLCADDLQETIFQGLFPYPIPTFPKK